MEWYHYLSGFGAGLFLANFVPHFVHGTSGNPFPTPFAKPRGIGLSSPLTNVLWSLTNLVAGYSLFQLVHISNDDKFSLLAFFAGITMISIRLAKHFVHKHKITD